MPLTSITSGLIGTSAVNTAAIADGAVTDSKLNITDLTVKGNLTVQGALSALSGAYFVNTQFTVTSALSVVNIGKGPALYVSQGTGPGDIASFYDADGAEVLHVGNALNPVSPGIVGIMTSFPGETLTIGGTVSALGGLSAARLYSSSQIISAGRDIANFLGLNAGSVVSLLSSNTILLSAVTVAGTLSATNTLSVQQTLEKTSLSAGPILSDINFNLLEGSILYNLSASRTVSWSINLRGNASTTLNSIMSPGQTMTCVHLVSTATVSVYCSAVRVDGNLVIPRWQAGSAPNSGNLNSIDSYSFSVIKLDNALFQVLASQTQFS